MPSSNVDFQWYGDEFARDFAEASEAGLDKAAETLEEDIVDGFKSGHNDPVEGKGGKPRWVTGTLARAVGWGRTKDGAREVGLVDDGTAAHIYGPVHEFGGTITPKTKKMLAWVTNGKDRNDPEAEWAFAKQVVIPARPFVRPVANSEKTQKKLTEKYAATVRAHLEQSGGPE